MIGAGEQRCRGARVGLHEPVEVPNFPLKVLLLFASRGPLRHRTHCEHVQNDLLAGLCGGVDKLEKFGCRLRLVEVVAGSPAAKAGLRAGDLVLSVGREPVTDAQGIQRQLFAESIGVALPVTVLRNGAMVDVVAVPSELTG